MRWVHQFGPELDKRKSKGNAPVIVSRFIDRDFWLRSDEHLKTFVEDQCKTP